jgi:hypothetical protein
MKKKYFIDYKRGFYFMIIESFLLLFIMFGGAMNFIAISNNGGRMPFQAEYDYSIQTHFTFQEWAEVKFPLFTDVISFMNGYWSIGDFVMLIGVTLLLINGVLMVYSKWKFVRKIK